MRKDFQPFQEHSPLASNQPKFWGNLWEHAKPRSEKFLTELRLREEWRALERHLTPSAGFILDGGCGLGEWTEGLRRKGFSVFGLDFSQETQHINRQTFPEAMFLCGDLRALPLRNDSAQALFSWGAFEHFEEGLKPCLQEAFRVLQPGGWLLISVPFHNGRHMLRELWNILFSSHSYQTIPPEKQLFYQWRFSPQELHDELSNCGFHPQTILPVCFEEGFSRFVRSDLGLPLPGIHRVSRLLRHILPARFFAHMLLAVARKTASKPSLQTTSPS
jgi:SAM-dependent methyltransferase